MHGLIDDLRFALRLIFKSPAAAFGVVLVLALGIGANTAIFTIVDCVLIRPLPFANPDRLTMLWETEPELAKAPVTGPDYQDWKNMARSFDSIAGGRCITKVSGMTGLSRPNSRVSAAMPTTSNHYVPARRAARLDPVIALRHE